jgi:hypothetical protein
MHCSRSHCEDLVDLDALAPMYVAAQLRECDRVQQAFHDSLRQFMDAKIDATIADIRRGVALAQQRGDELIAVERARVSNSLNCVQAQVARLPLLEDKGAFVLEMMGERCHPWFRLDVAHAVTDCVDVFRTDVAAPASQVLSVLQPQQLYRPGISTHVVVIMHFRNGHMKCHSFEMSSSDTVAHLKLNLEKKTGIARNRLLVERPRYCIIEGQANDELYFDQLKMSVYVDHPDQIITI